MYKEAGFKWRHDLLPKYVQSKQGGSFLVSRELIINSDFYKWTTVELEREGAEWYQWQWSTWLIHNLLHLPGSKMYSSCVKNILICINLPNKVLEIKIPEYVTKRNSFLVWL